MSGLIWEHADQLEKRQMNAEQADLYRRIQKFSVDNPSSDFPFSRRLAQENGWTDEFTQRVINEYKKFAFLAVAAEHPVAPSDQVDQAWHLHLVYTHSYWDEFCQIVLQKPLHHSPTQGGPDEQAKFIDWYNQTLTSYAVFFGYAPPEDIWPAVEVRFAPNNHFVRVNPRQSWIVPKPRLDPRTVAALPLMFVLFFTVCELFIPELVRPIKIWNPLSFSGPEFLKFYFMVAGIGAAFAFYWRWRLQQPTPLESPPQLDAYETAYLSTGGYRAINTAIVSLCQRGHLNLLPEIRTLAFVNDLPEDSHPLEQAIMQAVEIDGQVGRVRLSVLPAIEPIGQNLHALGLLLNNDQAQVFRYYPALIACAVLPLGITKLLLGISLQKPVGYLIMLCVLIGWLGYFFLKEKPLYRSRLGDRLLNTLRSKHKDLKKTTQAIYTPPLSQLVLAFALFGSGALTGSSLADLGSTLAPAAYSISGTVGVSGGCGGGYGGCGGGGCGGCGGG